MLQVSISEKELPDEAESSFESLEKPSEEHEPGEDSFFYPNASSNVSLTANDKSDLSSVGLRR